MNAVDADALRRHLRGHVAGQRLEAELRRRVMRAAREHFRRLDRSDVHDRRLPLFARRRAAEHLRAQPGAAKVDVDEAGPLIVGQLEERHDRLDAGVVDEDVDRPELVPDALEHRLDLRAARHVGLHRHRAAPGRPDRCGDLLRPARRGRRRSPRRPPSAANTSAMPRPIPRAAPVTSATFPSVSRVPPARNQQDGDAGFTIACPLEESRD